MTTAVAAGDMSQARVRARVKSQKTHHHERPPILGRISFFVMNSIDERSHANNRRAVTTLRTIVYVAAGIAAGVLGFTGSAGLAMYLVMHCLLVGVVAVSVGFKLPEYFSGGWRSVALTNLFDEIMPFVLFWSLAYSLVHVF